MKFAISRFRGRPTTRVLTLCPAGKADLPALWQLQKEIVACLPDPALFVATPEAELAAQLEHGFLLQLRDQGQIAGYVCVEYCGASPRSYAADMGLDLCQQPFWANLDTVLVHPDYRGNGLQRLLLGLAEQRLDPAIRGLGCTVSPHNPHSLDNFLACGYQPVCRKEKYGGFDRLVLAKPLRP